jgi:hypothetical protein
MAANHDPSVFPVVTATLTTGSARVTRGMRESVELVDEIMRLEHEYWESILLIGDVEYHQTPKKGPFPARQMIVSSRPSAGYAALNFTDNDDSDMPVANSYNPVTPLTSAFLVLNGVTGSVFPRQAAIPIPDAQNALHEWLRTQMRPTCIEWQPFDR